jgi:hypothetical protein
MKPKEKAKELVDKFRPHSHFWVHDLGRQKDYDIEQLENAKQCALIAVDEILKSKKQNIIHFYRCGDEFCECAGYWYEVKQEIELL